MIILMILITIAMIVWLILSAVYHNCFWGINFADWVTLMVTIVLGYIVAYILVEKNNRRRKFQEVFLEKIRDLEKRVYNAMEIIDTQYLSKDCKVLLLTSSKNISNLITLLEKYKEDMGVQVEVEFIRGQFIEYKTLATDCVELLKKDSELREKADLKLSLIASKLDEIELKLCE